MNGLINQLSYRNKICLYGGNQMREAFFLQLLETSSAHRQKSREGFQKLNLTEGQPKILYILYIKDGHTQKNWRNCAESENPL